MEVHRDHARAFTLVVEGKTVQTPSFVPAVSTVETQVTIQECLEPLVRLNFPRFLVSAFDYFHLSPHSDQQRLAGLLETSSMRGALVVMDSGVYEAEFKKDKSWSISKYEEVLGETSADVCFSFDKIDSNESDLASLADTIATYVARTAGAQLRGLTIPVLHAGGASWTSLVKRVVERLNPQAIAIPERELAPLLLQRAAAVAQIRAALDATGRRIPLHLLGVGDPLSIAVYAVSGADTFDGLEWTRTKIDPEKARPYPTAQGDLVVCSCKACTDPTLPVRQRAMAHNLLFLEGFMGELRRAILEERQKKFLDRFLPREVVSRLTG